MIKFSYEHVIIKKNTFYRIDVELCQYLGKKIKIFA